jgi:uroporphyrinogen decarboxylase
MSPQMTSMERVLTALSHKEPDRVPVFLFVTMHGAKELDLSIQDYFSAPEHVIEGQLRLRRKFGHDCLYAITYGAVDYEAFGGEALFSEDGPPNAGAPVIRSREDIFQLQVPDIASEPRLQAGLEIVRGLAEAARGEVPVIGSVISPYSLPVMLMGYARYLDLLYDDLEAFERLMSVTKAFALSWAKAQFAAGATACGYFDPLSANDQIEEGLWRRTGLPIIKEMLAGYPGPGALHFASGRALGRVPTYLETGAAALGVSSLDDLADLKRQVRGRVSLMGNLDGIRLARWNGAEIEAAVRACIDAAAPGGGFVLADHHGEIPFQVADEALHSVVEAARRWGTYPIQEQSDA